MKTHIRNHRRAAFKTYVITTFVIVALSVQPAFAQGAKGAIAKKITAWLLGGAAVAGGAAATYAALNPKDVEAELAAKIQRDLNNNRDKFFHKIHPVGKATSIKVHEVKSHWKTAKPRNLDDLVGFDVRYTIFWDGPIQKDGFTKLISTYDAEVERYVDTSIIATSGITNDDAVNASISFLTGLL